MRGGAAAARSRPTTELHEGGASYPLYSLFPTTQRSNVHKVTESVYSTPLSLAAQTSSVNATCIDVIARRLPSAQNKSSIAMEGDKSSCMGTACCGELGRGGLDSGTLQPLAVKTEHARRGCCLNSPKKLIHEAGGCSRTNPVAWVGVPGPALGGLVQVKREPPHVHISEMVAVKLEQASPGTKPDPPVTLPASINNGSIPVGIAVARQRVGDAGLLAALSQKDNHNQRHDLDAAQAAMTVGVANVLCDDRSAPLAWPAPPAPAAPLWQYPAQMSMDSMMMGGMGSVGVGSVGMSPVGGGFQLVREPSSGALLLLPTPPDLPHTVLWGGVPYPSAPLILPPPPHPSHHLQLLPGEILASTATLQHTHTHSTRLVTLAPAPPQPHPSHADKRKPIMQPLITPHALIKIETEPIQEKQQTFVPEPVQQPVLSHVYYQPQAEFSEPQVCRSQATSPAAPHSPPHDAHDSPAHKDASNQTDHIEDDDDSPNHADDHDTDVACVGVAHTHDSMQPSIIDSAEDSSSEALTSVTGAVEKAIDAIERDEAMDTSSSGGSNDLVIDTETNSPSSQQSNPRPSVDVSGLELLSNSIEQFERTTPGLALPVIEPAPLTIDTRTPANVIIKTSPKSPPRTDVEPHRVFEFPSVDSNRAETNTKPSFDGLGLLCALAEQRFMEEVETPSPSASARPFIKSESTGSSERQRSSDRSESSKKERRRHRAESRDRRAKRSRDRDERLRHKMDKIRRHKRDRDGREGREGRQERGSGDGELEASLRRVAACACAAAGGCAHRPSAQALVRAVERDMRARLQDLQRQCDEKRAQLHALSPPPPPPADTAATAAATPPEPLSPLSDRGSSKKRKVGRPRKLSSPDSSTETIVAKKPKSKSSLVGFLLAKSKLKGGIVYSKTDATGEERTSKVRPKLKAEPIVKMFSEEEEADYNLNRSTSSSMESLQEIRQKNREKVDKLVRKHSRDSLPELELLRRTSASSDSDKERRKAKKRRKSLKPKEEVSEEKAARGSSVSQCTLTEEQLETSPRVLTAMGGLFYAGRLSAVRAPDVYAITLDGERGNKPHILSREETLRDAILEVCPTASSLTPGTRVCAYWSQQYRCLYPGTVASEPRTDSRADPETDHFVPVEFDDGDSGRIALPDIRLLLPDYPIVEYENSLFTLGKRRRNTSVNSTEEKKPNTELKAQPSTSADNNQTEEERNRDRKKVKKHRKEKRHHSTDDDPNADYVKKKKKKHKCCEEHCKHRRHHKKHHRKHRKRHSSCKEHSSSSSDDRLKVSDFMDLKEDSTDSNEKLSTLIAMEKSPEEKMKTVIKKAVLPKKNIVRNAVLDFSNLGKLVAKKEEEADNLKDSGICLEDEPSTSDASKKKSKRRSTSTSSEVSPTGAATGATGAPGGIGGSQVSKMAAFLPPGAALWSWRGPATRRTAKPRVKKMFYKAIQRGEEVINVGEACVFLSTGRPDRPYIGRVAALWSARGAMTVRVQWYYHPAETARPPDLPHQNGLFESPHTDENDVQTISHKCEVVSLAEFLSRRAAGVDDLYYLAGRYDPVLPAITLQEGVTLVQDDANK